jgi:hypothetical protein
MLGSRLRAPRRLLCMALLCLALVAVGLAGCGSSSSSSGASTTGTTPHVALAKTKFVLHAGLAFGAFHHYIYLPFRNHQLGFLHPIKDAEAALGAAFVVHELKLAETDAKASPLLSKLLSPLFALQNAIGSFTSGLKHGSTNSSALNGANSSIASISSASAAAGQPVQDISHSL